jgi:glutamine amidotransferase
MTSGLLNADGFGVGWYHPHRQIPPCTYKNTLPIWSDINLPGLSRYVESGCILANVRSATPGQAVDLSNCQPFSYGNFLGIHNGFIRNFHQTLYRPLRQQLDDQGYQDISGTTDSEHILALLLHLWRNVTDPCLESALSKTLTTLANLATSYETEVSANLIVSDGQQLIASRFATQSPAPSLYWLQDDPTLPAAVVIASEPLFEGNWVRVPEDSLLTVSHNREVQLTPL